MSDGDINFHDTNVSGGQNNIGRTDIQGGQHQTNNNAGATEINVQDVLKQIAAAVPEGDRETVEREITKPLEEIASKAPPEDEKEAASWKARIMEYASKLEPYTPYIRKTIAAFAEGALKTIPPPASWVLGGVMEVVKDHRKD